jgi:hypothetical protein
VRAFVYGILNSPITSRKIGDFCLSKNKGKVQVHILSILFLFAYISYQALKILIKDKFLLCTYIFTIYWLFWIGLLAAINFYGDEHFYFFEKIILQFFGSKERALMYFPIIKPATHLLSCVTGLVTGSIFGLWLYRNYSKPSDLTEINMPPTPTVKAVETVSINNPLYIIAKNELLKQGYIEIDVAEDSESDVTGEKVLFHPKTGDICPIPGQLLTPHKQPTILSATPTKTNSPSFFYTLFYMIRGSILCAFLNMIILFTGSLIFHILSFGSNLLFSGFYVIHDYNSILGISSILNITILIGISPVILKYIAEYIKQSNDPFFKTIKSIPSYLENVKEPTNNRIKD